MSLLPYPQCFLLGGGELVDKAGHVTEMSMLFSAMQAEALTTRATLEMIESTKDRMKA